MQTMASISALFLISTILTFANRTLLATEGANFPSAWILTFCHMLFTFAYGFSRLGREEFGMLRSNCHALFALGVCHACSIGMNNLSLVYITVSLNHVVKMCTPILTFLAERFLHPEEPTHETRWLSIIMIVIGSAMICHQDHDGDTSSSYGIAIAFASSCFDTMRALTLMHLLRSVKLSNPGVLTFDAFFSMVTLSVPCTFDLPKVHQYFSIWWMCMEGTYLIVLSTISAVVYNCLLFDMSSRMSASAVSVVSTLRQLCIIVVASSYETNIDASRFAMLLQICIGSAVFAKCMDTGGARLLYDKSHTTDARVAAVYAALTLTGMCLLVAAFQHYISSMPPWYRGTFYDPDGAHGDAEAMSFSKRAAFVTSCNDHYVLGVLGLWRSMQKVNSSYPLVVIGQNLSSHSKGMLQRVGILVEQSVHDTYGYSASWSPAFVKLQSWKLERYDRVCWMDADTVMLQNIDNIMSIPLHPDGVAVALDFETRGPTMSRTPPFRMIQSGLFLLTPNNSTYERMMSDMGRLPSLDDADQGFLTSYFGQVQFNNSWILPTEYNYMYGCWSRDPGFDAQHLKVLHFTERPKPWAPAEDEAGARKSHVWESLDVLGL
jgi:drug/metabolite transporter (DMT)-like permease